MSSSSPSGLFVIAGYYQPHDVLHFQCYAAAKNDAASGSSFANHHHHHHHGAAADCCTSILRAQSRIQAINKELEAVAAVDDDDDQHDYPRFGGRIFTDLSVAECEQNLLYLRHAHPPLMGQSWLLYSVFPQQSLPLPLPLFGMLTLTPNKTATRNLESDPDPCLKVVDQNAVQWCSWRWFLWNDTADSGHWIIGTAKETKPSSRIMNAAWVPTRARDHELISTITTDAEPQIQNGNSNAASFIHLSSTLSKSGGMHRELRQKLTFSIPTTDLLASSEETSAAASLRYQQQYDYSIDILLSIPSGLFINVEDASFTTVPGMKITISSISSSSRRGGSGVRTVSNEDDCSKVGTNANNSTDTALVIDQEEPAFVSPSHLVLCRLTGPLASAPVVVDSPLHHESNGGQGPDSSLLTTIELTWDTHLHVRYPLPIQNNIDNQNSHHDYYYSQITFMPPMIAAGEIFNSKTGHSFTLMSANGADATHDGVAAPFWMLPRQAPHTLWVAAGHQDDFGPVFVLTLLAALIGTVVLLRDMMFLYKQDDASSSTTKMASQSSSPLLDRQLKTKKDE